jgi:PAS domain S-box-containing protein
MSGEQASPRPRLQVQQAALLEILSRGIPTSGMADAFRALTEMATRVLQVRRASVWLFDEERKRLVLSDLFDSEAGTHESGAELTARDYPAYFAALRSTRAIVARDARSDPRTREFGSGYLGTRGIRSMLDTGIWQAGEVRGAVCLESVGILRDWSADDEQFAGTIADLAMIALEHEASREARQRLLESEQLFEGAFQLSPDPISIVRLEDNQVIHVNGAFERLCGYPAAELEGRDASTLEIWVDPERRKEFVARIGREGVVRDFDAPLRLSSGEVRELQLSAYTVRIAERPHMVTISRDLTERRRQERLVSEIAQGVGAVTGESFFRSLVKHLTQALDAELAFVGEVQAEPGCIRTIAAHSREGEMAPFEYSLAGSPCETVVGRGICAYPSGVAARFPDDRALQRMGIEAYVGAPLIDSNGEPLGLVAVLFKSPLEDSAIVKSLLSIFAARASGELERRRALQESHGSRKRLELAIDAMNMLVWEIPRGATQVSWSGDPAKVLGIAASRLGTFEAWSERLHPEERERVVHVHQELARGNVTTLNLDYRLRRDDGTYITVCVDAFRVQDSAGDSPQKRVIGVARDVTAERERSEAALRATERFRVLFHSSATPSIISRQRDRTHTECNDAFCDMFGYSREEVIGRTSVELGLFRDWGDRDRGFAEYLATGRVFNAEHDMVTKSGEVRRVLRSLTAVDIGDEPMILVQIIDITERKRAEDQLRANRRLLEIVIDAIPMSIFAKDPQSNYVMVNKYMAEFHGMTKEELLRLHTTDLPIPDATRRKSLEDDQWVFANRAVLDQPLAMLQRPDGAYVPFHSTKIPLVGDHGELVGLLGVNRDLTQDRRVQEELRASRRLLENVIDSIPLFVFVKDLQGRFMVVNKHSADFYGVTKEAILEGGAAALPVSEASLKAALAEDAWVRENRATLVVEESLREFGGGRVLPIHCIKVPLFADDGELVGVLGVLRDISQEKRAADELRAAQQALEEANLSLERTVVQRTTELQSANAELSATLENLMQSKEALVRSEKLAALGRLVAGVAHELNTPIGNSLLSASTLAERTEEFSREASAGAGGAAALSGYAQDAREASRILLRNLERAGEIIRSFKQVAVDQASSQRRAFALDEVVEEVMLTHRPMLRGSRVEIRADIPSGLRFDSYPGPLGQVLGNLITNAALHGYDHGASGTVEITAGAQGKDRVRIAVRDRGQGIAREHLARIFDPFFTTRMGRGGSGLGLGICHNIVEKTLGGTIEVESQVGKGTTVITVVPLVAPVGAARTAQASHDGSARERVPQSGAGGRDDS